ncbi:MAG TPA: glycerate-2-kinase family protein, partial [Labilithrix sp.]|nr:glycerate-2-kinase family protein [Labilithrix sp.]
MTRLALARLLGKALGELDLGSRVASSLGEAGPLPVRVVAIGKAAPAMAAGAVARWGRAIERCLVVAPDETSADGLHEAAAKARVGGRVTVLRAGHPLPDARSVRAGRACLEAMASTEPRQLLVLVSGGASALVSAPSAGISLRTKRAVTRALLASGASVQELNVVRKHLSRIKGGGLARAAGDNAVRTLIASDVIGGTAADVGSGPSVPDPSTIADARRVLRRFAPAYAELPLARTTAARRAPPRVEVVASPEVLAAAVGRLLGAAGE